MSACFTLSFKIKMSSNVHASRVGHLASMSRRRSATSASRMKTPEGGTRRRKEGGKEGGRGRKDEREEGGLSQPLPHHPSRPSVPHFLLSSFSALRPPGPHAASDLLLLCPTNLKLRADMKGRVRDNYFMISLTSRLANNVCIWIRTKRRYFTGFQ